MLPLSWEFLPNDAPQDLHLCRGQVALLVLGVHVEHVECLLPRRPVVDEPQPASLAPTPCAPPEFAEASGARNQRPLLGPQQQRQLQSPILVLVDEPAQPRRENTGLEQRHRSPYFIGVSSASPCDRSG